MLPKYNAFQLKLFMAILMVFDHIDHIHNNIFFPLALGVLMLCVLAGSDPLPLRICGVVFLVLFASIFAEGGIVVLPFMLITYLCRDRILLRNLLYLALGVLLFVMSFVPYPTLSETLTMLAINSEFMFPLVIPFLAMYDGTRGPKTAFSKYFFYVFYPLHLWIIGLIALLVR